MKLNPLTTCDFYKVSHREMYPEGTELVYSNFTPRSTRLFPTVKSVTDNRVVFVGLQGFIQWFLIDVFDDGFFDLPKGRVIDAYKRRMDNALGAGMVSTEHLEALHDLGYLPLEIMALPEGSKVDPKVPVYTVYNTLPEFYWLVNYLETVFSNSIWKPMVAATTAYRYRQVVEKYLELTGVPKELAGILVHDFSCRGLSGPYDAQSTGMSHLVFFEGTDTISAIDYAEEYYGADSDTELVGCSVPACYDGDTEVLTEKGFVRFEDLGETSRVAQYHEDGTIDFVEPTTYYKMPYKGDMIEFSKSGHNYVDALVTPKHKMVRLKNGAVSLFEAGDFSYRNRNGYSHRNSIIVSGKTRESSSKFSELDRLRVAFQADGSFPSRAESYKSGQVRFSLKKERKKIRLEGILKELGYKYTRSDYDNGYTSFWINPENTAEFQKDFEWVSLGKSPEWYEDFVSELAYWDGCFKNNCVVYSSTQKSCVDKVQAVCSVSRRKGQVSMYEDKRGDSVRLPIYTITIQKDKTTISGHRVSRAVRDFNGVVYCVSVPTKMLVVRRSGCVMVCGNTEHSVMCMGGKETELETFRRLIKLHPEGVLAIVSDTWDFWKVITEFAAELKDEIEARQPNALGLAKVVFRPDSGNPVDILCGIEVEDFSGVELEYLSDYIADYLSDKVSEETPHGECGPDSVTEIIKYGDSYYEATCKFFWNRHDKQYYYLDSVEDTTLKGATLTPEQKGAVQCLYETFGGSVTDTGHILLNERVGLIYGDSITLERCEAICQRLMDKGFATGNVVFGVGSYTYQYVTRDTIGGAMKATYGVINGEGIEIYKDPKTDSGEKKSAKGLLVVEEVDSRFKLKDQATWEQVYGKDNAMRVVYRNGRLTEFDNLATIRNLARA